MVNNSGSIPEYIILLLVLIALSFFRADGLTYSQNINNLQGEEQIKEKVMNIKRLDKLTLKSAFSETWWAASISMVSGELLT